MEISRCALMFVYRALIESLEFVPCQESSIVDSEIDLANAAGVVPLPRRGSVTVANGRSKPAWLT